MGRPVREGRKLNMVGWRWRRAAGVFCLLCCGCNGGSLVDDLPDGVFLDRTPAGTVDTMLAVTAGDFLMGTNRGFDPEGPAHVVYLSAFYIDKYEVTNAQFRAYARITGASLPPENLNPLFSEDRQPVVGVTWTEAEAYCHWRGGRLPTEAQWEKAARGTDGRTYPWGEEAPGGDFAVMDLGGRCGRTNWADPSAGPVPGEFCHTMPVGSRPRGASPYGLLDMAGNAWEWCNDWYDDTYYGRSPGEDPSGPASGTFRVVRGSSWHHLPHYLKTSARFRFYPDQRGNFIGFRCVRGVHQ